MFKFLKIFILSLFPKFKTINKNTTENIDFVSPRFFHLNDFEVYRLKRMDTNINLKNKNTFLFFTKFLNKLLKKKFKNFLFFKIAKIHSFFIILIFSYIIFYYFILDRNFDIYIPLSYYFHSHKPEDLIIYLQNFEEIKKNQNFHFFSSEKISNSPFFSKFFFFDAIFFSPEDIKIPYEQGKSHFFKQFFENSLEKPLYKYKVKEKNNNEKIVDFSEENTDFKFIIEKSLAATKQKEYIENLISKKEFFLFNTPKYKENFIKISRFQNFIADLGLLDIKISDFNQTFIEKQFPFKATHYKKSHIQALAELGINSKDSVLNNDQNFYYQKSDYERWSELNINIASNKFFLIQDQLNFFFFKNLDFKLFLLNKSNVNLNCNCFDFILDKYDIDLTKNKDQLKNKKFLNLITNSYSDKINKSIKFDKESAKYNKVTKEIIKFDLIKKSIKPNVFINFFNNYNSDNYININKNNFIDLYFFWFNYFDFTFLKYNKKRDFLYMLLSHETGFFSFPEDSENVDENFFKNRKKKFKKLKKIDPFKEHVYAITQEQYEEILTANLDIKIIVDNPEYNKYQEGYFDFIEGFTDKFIVSNNFIHLNKDLNLNYQFVNLMKYNENYNKLFYFFDIKLNRIKIQIEINRKKIINHILQNIIENYKENNKSNILIKKDLINLKNDANRLINLLKLNEKLTKNLNILKKSTINTHFIGNNIINFYINNSIENYKFINNSFIYNLEKKNFNTDILKKKLYFFNIYNDFLSKNFNYFFTKKIISKFSYVHLNTFNKDFLSYFKHITYYFKEHRFLFFYDFRNKEFIKNYKIYEDVLKSNYGKNKDFDSYLFMSSNYNILNSNFNLFFINNLKNTFKQQFCWNNLQNKNLKLNNNEINIILGTLKSLFYYFKLNNHNLENILLSKHASITKNFLNPKNNCFLIFNNLEQHIKENLQNKFLLQNYYDSPRFFITTFDRLNFFLKYNYYHGRIFKKLNLTEKEDVQTTIIFTYTENILDKSLLLRTQNRFLSLEYYSIIDKISKIETSLDLINLEKKNMPAALNMAYNDINMHFEELRPFVEKYPFPFVGEHLLLEREFIINKRTILLKKTRFNYFKKILINVIYVISNEFSLKYFNIEFWKYQMTNFFLFFNIDLNSTEKLNTDTTNKNLMHYLPKFLQLKYYIKFFDFAIHIREIIFFYVNSLFFENYSENYIELKNLKKNKEKIPVIFYNEKLFENWLYYVFFFVIEKSFLNYYFLNNSFYEYNLLENQRLICLDLNFEKKIGLNSANLNITSEVFSINSKLMTNLFQNLNYFYYNELSKSYNIFKFTDFLKDDYYDEEDKENNVDDNDDDDNIDNGEEIINLTIEQQKFNNINEELNELKEDAEDYTFQLNDLFFKEELTNDIDILPREDRMNINEEKYFWLFKSFFFIYGDEYKTHDATFFTSQIKGFMSKMSKE